MTQERASGLVAVLFTDLAGSTEVMGRVGERAYDDLRQAHLAMLTGVVSAHHGAVVKNTGDGILATFPAAADAAEAAVALQQAVARQAHAGPVPLQIRVGLALGDATLEDGDVFGTPVIEAARLVAMARPGQILCTALVRAVAGSRTGVVFTNLEPVALKGLPDPVAVCEVAWAPLEAAAVSLPLPALLVRPGRIFVGREAELEGLTGRWKAAVAGERRMALLGGEPGIGKTRLSAELAATVHAEGAVVLAGRCDEDLGVPYQPFVEALRHYVAHAPPPLRLGRHAGELTRLVPEVGDVVPGLPPPLRSDPETERYRLFDALAGWLSDVSVESPTLLVLDDLHWAAKPTVLLLRHVLRSPEPMRLLLVGTYRDTDIGRDNPLADLLGDVHRLDGAERVGVSGLDASGVAAYIEAAAGHDLDDEGEAMARAVWRETEGNCFFVAEVLRHLAESGALEQRDGRWVATGDVAELGIPEGVRDVVGRRLSRLSAAANRVLATASVLGLEFEPAVVEAAGGFSEEDVLAAMEEAAAARLLVDVAGTVPRNRFSHALVRATLYDELSTARRASLHRRAAEAIESVHAGDLDDHLPTLAYHWSRAGQAPEQAIDYATRSGHRALAQLAHDEAASFYAQALELVAPDDPRRLDLLIALGDAQHRAGDPAARGTLLRAGRLAEERGDAGALARAALAGSRSGFMSSAGTVDEDRMQMLEAALAAMEVAPTAVRARLLASLAVESVYSGRRESRLQLSDEALAIARGLDDPATSAYVLMMRVHTILGPGALDELMVSTAELLELARRVGDPVVEFGAHWSRARVLLHHADMVGAHRHLERAEALATELGQPTLRWMARWMRVGPTLRSGQVDAAERLADEAYEIGRGAGLPDAAIVYTGQRFLIRFEQGRLGEVHTELSEIFSRYPALPGLRAWLALTLCEMGREEEAEPLFAGLAEASFDLPRDPTWLGMLTMAAEVARRLGDRSSAGILYDLLLPYADVFSITASMTTGCTAHYLGILATVLGRLDDAERHFADAAAAHGRAGAPAHVGRTRVETARLLLARHRPGDAERARDLLAQALAAATDLGFVTVERQARAVLEQLS